LILWYVKKKERGARKKIPQGKLREKFAQDFPSINLNLQTKAVIDYTEYALNLTQANEEGSPTWRPMYHFLPLFFLYF
jgi:hypothetical protein